MKAPIVIAEIGCNHKGDINVAKELIMIAATFAKCDFIKFQKRNNKELLTVEEYNSPHPNQSHAYGVTYGEHREFLEFSLEQHKELQDFCSKYKIGYSCSVWDVTSAKEIISLMPPWIKIPSALNQNKELLEYLCRNYEGDIHVSFGMTTREEEEEVVTLFEKEKRNKQLVIYSCTSGYPVAFEDICLYEIARLKKNYVDTERIKAIGFSGHHLGIAADIAGMTLGAQYIERHYTLDRTWKGTDHAASLEPDGLRKLVRDIRNVSKALDFKKKEILDVEEVQRKKLKKNQLRWK